MTEEATRKKSGINHLPLRRFVQKYLKFILLLNCLIILAVFWGFHMYVDTLFRDQLVRQGRSFFHAIVMTRLWMASHGGVYVRMTPGVKVNPYLEKIPGVRTLIRDETGQLYVLKNPALVTREISELADRRGILKFHITSLKPLNPNNRPDAFEEKSLRAFQSGIPENHIFEENRGKVLFRYMAPLITEASCLKCHGAQGYQRGDVRGGISVAISTSEMVARTKTSRLVLTALVLGVMVLTGFIIYVVARFFIRELGKAEDRLVTMATQDPLTGLFNRRETFSRIDTERTRCLRSSSPLSIIMCDIDHFKRINDTYGHVTGDFVLQALADVLRQSVRSYDIVCRYGGEEFLIAAPETTAIQATELSERIRTAVEQTDIKTASGHAIRITVSLGASQMHGSEKIEETISRADQALYEAKNRGRNRVHVL